MQKETFSVSWLATNLGMDRRTVSRRLESLTPAKSGRTGRGAERRYHLREALEAIFFERKQAEGELDLWQERARLARAQTQRIELEQRVRNRELITLAEARGIYGDRIVRARARLIQVPPAVAALFAPDIAPRVEQACRERIYEALSELAAGAPPGDDDQVDERDETDEAAEAAEAD